MTDRLIELERADAARQALLAGAETLERQSVGDKYRQALKLGARLLREMAGTFGAKPGTDKTSDCGHE